MFTSPAYKLKVPACFATQRVNRQCTFKVSVGGGYSAVISRFKQKVLIASTV